MGALDGVARNVASSLIKKFGRDSTATITTSQGYNPALGYAETTTSTATVKGVVARWNHAEILGSQIRMTDIKFVVAAQGNTAPTMNDTFTIDGVEFEVVEIREVWSGEQVAYYHVALRA